MSTGPFYRARPSGGTAALLPVELLVGPAEDARQRVLAAGRGDPGRPAERVARLQPLEDLVGSVDVGGRQAQHELVAPVPAEQVGLAQPAGPLDGQIAQEGVAGAVPQPVVDLL